ncbi:unnamed protein product [Lepeophtheirus salmonis]|uniref:(salmon louse) hypothetical protein n=1 Tax=Lepeophtheirus salmonis TaxID=72036 RepID=A0A7R8GZ72_LEPSM|nr:unnamed protein product [Lepeophtheirus salmonis]CAF2760590.1 unnamed protein product [Lepeophtheirus salmonis]
MSEGNSYDIYGNGETRGDVVGTEDEASGKINNTEKIRETVTTATPSNGGIRSQSPLSYWLCYRFGSPVSDYRSSIANATLLVHPVPSAHIDIMVEASYIAVCAVPQQRTQNGWQTLALFS